MTPLELVIQHVRAQNRPGTHQGVLLAEVDRLRAEPKLTFDAIRQVDDIRRENHCTAICAYPDGCVCWSEITTKESNDV